MDAGTDPGGIERPGPDQVGRDAILEVATALFARRGPGQLTLKWVALEADIPVDRISDEWSSIEELLGDVLDRLADEFRALAGQRLDEAQTARQNEMIDTFQRIIARSLLDQVNTGDLLSTFSHVEQLTVELQTRFGLDERSTRFRLAQGYALEWGWHLFGPHLKTACGLDDEPDDVMLAELRRTERRIARLPLPSRDR